MFFSLERQANPLFTHRYQLGDLVLNTDSGWSESNIGDRVYVFKGYVDEFLISDALELLTDHSHSGNFCVFVYHNTRKTIEILTNRWRGFNMFYSRGLYLSNLNKAEYVVWNDSTVEIDQNLHLNETKKDIIGDISTGSLSRQQALLSIHAILQKKISDFLNHNNRPLKVFLSGGIDSMLVFSYIQSMTDRYELILENTVQWDGFWCMNQSRITKQFWAYKQIHHWLDPCVLSSGAPGDEFMLRSPTTANLWLKYHGTSIPQQMDFHPNCLHRSYFDQSKHLEIFDHHDRDPSAQQLLASTRQEFYWNLCNLVANDCQHWHLGQTLTFTPLRDLEIFKIFLRLELDDAKGQILDSAISRDLISINNADLLALLSDQKNSGEPLANLQVLLDR